MGSTSLDLRFGNPETGWPKHWYTKSRLLFWGCLYIGLHDFRNFRSDLEDFRYFRSDFRDFRDCQDFKELKYFYGFGPFFKEFRSGVRDFSD